jgi:hypothetical protein
MGLKEYFTRVIGPRKKPLEFIYFNESGDEIPASYHKDQKRSFLFGQTRGVKWNYGKSEISFMRPNRIIHVCPLQTKDAILLIYSSLSFHINDMPGCPVHDGKGKFLQWVPYPGFRINYEGVNRVEGNCYNLYLGEQQEGPSKIVCIMERSIRNGWGSEWAKFVFDEISLSFGEPVEKWETG